MTTLGLDIGGANLKAADGFDAAVSVPFPLWKNPAGLTKALRSLAGGFAPFDRLAVTMTGELCDCFETKAAGVAHILDACDALAAGRPVHVWQTAGEFVDPAAAREFWCLTAAANWHASATFAGRCVPEGNALFVDMGSTTTDLIPLSVGVPMPFGRTDYERLRSGELLYRGARRTPLCVDDCYLGDEGDGGWAVPAAETFATAADAYVVLGLLPEDSDDRDTADGRPLTRDQSLRRIARMLCADRGEVAEDLLVELAWNYRTTVENRLDRWVELSAAWPGWGRRDRVLIAGSGTPILRGWLDRIRPEPIAEAEVIDLADLLSPAVSAALPAHAVARLCDERC